MNTTDIVIITRALALSRNFLERYPQGRTSPEEAAELVELNTQAIAALSRPEKGFRLVDYRRVEP